MQNSLLIKGDFYIKGGYVLDQAISLPQFNTPIRRTSGEFSSSGWNPLTIGTPVYKSEDIDFNFDIDWEKIFTEGILN